MCEWVGHYMAGSWGSESDDLGISSDGSDEAEAEAQRPPRKEASSAEKPTQAAPSEDAGTAATEGDEAELQEYAKSLGVDLNKAEEASLRWVVKEAFAAPLPVSWTEHLDEEGRVYFFNQITQESSWLHPMDGVFKEVIDLVKVHQKTPSASNSKAGGAQSSSSSAPTKHDVVQAHLEQAHKEALAHIEAWSGPYTSEAGQYYYNSAHDVSSWENPIYEWQKQLALRQRILHRCLLEDEPLTPQSVAAAGELSRQSSEGEVAEPGHTAIERPSFLPGVGDPLLEFPRLPPLSMPNLAAGEAGPKSPSSTRSFATARSGRSARSARSPTPTRVLASSMAAIPAAGPRGTASPKGASRPKAVIATPKVAATVTAPDEARRMAADEPRQRKSSGDGEELEFTFGSTQNLQLPRFGAVSAAASS